jgi:hypothetical protein
MKDRKAKSTVKVAHRNDRTQIKRVLGESGRSAAADAGADRGRAGQH